MTLRALIRGFATTGRIAPKVCIVGSGPAGFYAAHYLANKLQTAQIDILERLPVPFGLVRYGVAPDHQDLKKCINSFTKTAQIKTVNFYGNINLGRDVFLKELKEAYHVVILAYGVDDCRTLDIKGGNLSNILQAKNVVGWYNGLPWDKSLQIDLSGSRATVFGHGNVAIDVARILLSPIDKLKVTDITAHALAILSQSKITEVSLVGRRGPLQVAFTTKELRELLNFKDCCTVWSPEDMHPVADVVPQLVKPRKRLTELMVQKYQSQRPPLPHEKQLKMVFLRSPKQFKGGVTVKSVELSINRLEGEDLIEKRAVETGNHETVETDLVVECIGYKSVQVDPDVPFDAKRGVVRNTYGVVEDGVYAAGWVAKGATGVFAHTMEHAFGVAATVLKDLETGDLTQDRPGFQYLKNLLDRRNVQVVTWDDWLKIDEYEKKEGKKLNKVREKIVDVEEMLKVAAS